MSAPSRSALTPVADAFVRTQLPAASLAQGDAPAVSRPAAARFPLHRAIDAGVLLALSLGGLLCPWGVLRWYEAALFAFALLDGGVLGAAAVITRFSEASPTRIQGVRRRPTLALRGVFDTSVSAWVAACLAAWPLSRAWAGLPIGLTWSLPPDQIVLAAIESLAGVVVLDAWLYWKHRLLHTRWLFPFHRSHHVYRDPTAFTSFAVGPVEALLTFWPTVLVAIPAATHFAPFYWPLVLGFIALNLYLHCGAVVPGIEALLRPFALNTSSHHNVHHANAEAHFAEALTIWDRICRTRLVDY